MKHEPWCPALRPSVFVGNNPCNCGARYAMVLRMAFAVVFAAGLFLLVLVYGAHAQTPTCHTIAEVVRLAQDMGGTSRPLTTRELDFARGMFVAQPTTPSDYPQGEGGLMLMRDGHMLIFFTRGELACEMIAVGADGVRNLDRIAHGPGAPS